MKKHTPVILSPPRPVPIPPWLVPIAPWLVPSGVEGRDEGRTKDPDNSTVMPSPRGLARRGFTLLELMIVLTIVALAVALVVPNMAKAYADVRLRLGARAVANLCLQARERALYRAETCLVVFGPVEDRERTIYLAAENGLVVNKAALPAGISLRGRMARGEWAEKPGPVHFFPNGTSEPFELDLAGQNKSHVRMRLDPLTGQLKVAELFKEQ